MSNIEFVDKTSYTGPSLLQNITIDGIHKQRLYTSMCSTMPSKGVDGIFSNGFNAMKYFANPISDKKNTSKVLCLGKVQSGKTAFFTTATCLSFDNGYNLAYLLGGTKNTLLSQNILRAEKEFECDPDVFVHNIKNTSVDDVKKELENGQKVIIVVLKNAAQNTNLGKLKLFAEELSNYPSVIIDDEGDEISPGAPKSKKKNTKAGKTHDMISEVISTPVCCTYLSVTATPQANLLLSTIDELSPDYITLVEPGYGYTGGNSFHDIMDNPHCIEIHDYDDFEDSIPESFESCLHFFFFACCLKQTKGNAEPFSMLVHPSSLQRIHTMVRSKIEDYIEEIKKVLSDSNNISYEDSIEKFRTSYKEYVTQNGQTGETFDTIIQHLPTVIQNVEIYEFNSKQAKSEFEEEKNDKSLYKIYVGGNMLGRGLTIKNLIVTYIYRDSKETAIDTLYQRARWFGYKLSYFDVCRVYMPKQLKEKFIATVENENDMWNSINSFLLNSIDAKRLPRLFTLNNDKLILTRKTVSKTIVYKRINPGYSYDKSVWFLDPEKDRAFNRSLYRSFLSKWNNFGKEVQFGNSSVQEHLIVEMKYSEFYKDFLYAYRFPRGSKFGPLLFSSILTKIQSGVDEDKIFVVVMRYKSGQFRGLTTSGLSIDELPQGRDDGTGYSGDKCLTGFNDKFHIQLHLVYHDKNKPDDFLPMLAMNNPITKFNVRFVTGDNDYETI